jgi:hypothetical protein
VGRVCQTLTTYLPRLLPSLAECLGHKPLVAACLCCCCCRLSAWGQCDAAYREGRAEGLAQQPGQGCSSWAAHWQ